MQNKFYLLIGIDQFLISIFYYLFNIVHQFHYWHGDMQNIRWLRHHCLVIHSDVNCYTANFFVYVQETLTAKYTILHQQPPLTPAQQAGLIQIKL